jgi:hypothetical protein
MKLISFHWKIKVWERSEAGFRGFQGCGSTWLPVSPGQHFIDVPIWKPMSDGLEGLSGTHRSFVVCSELKYFYNVVLF